MAVTDKVVRNKPIPRSRRAYYSETGERFSGIPSTENRALQIKRSDDKFKNMEIGLYDIDEAIKYYFESVIKPTVEENDQSIEVPTMYGYPERWQAVRSAGFMRDRRGKIIAPLIMYRRTSISRDESMPVDKLERNIFYTMVKTYNDRNRYDKFSIVNNLIPSHQHYRIIMPKYVRISYECIAWTSMISQMNKIIELINYSANSFWGDKNRFKFYTRIDSFDQAVEVSTDTDKAVKCNFVLELKGYLVPEFYRDLVNTQKAFTVKKIVLGTETEVDIDGIVKGGSVTGTDRKTIIPSPGLPIDTPLPRVNATTVADTDIQRLTYLLNEKVVLVDDVINNDGGGRSVIRIFKTASLPADGRAIQKTDFLIFVNGMMLEHDAIYLVQQVGTRFEIYVTIASLGYELDDTDEIYVFGSFD